MTPGSPLPPAALLAPAPLFWLGDADTPAPAELAELIAGRADLRSGESGQAALWAQRAPPGAAWLVDGRDRHAALAQVQWLDSLGCLGGPSAAVWWLWLPNGPSSSSTSSTNASPLSAEDGWRLGADRVMADAPLSVWQAALQQRCWQQQAMHGSAAQQRRLWAELQALRASLDHLPAPIFVKNAAGIYTECNRAFQDYLGLTREQIIGKTVFDISPPAQAAVYAQADQNLLSRGGRQIYEAQVRWGDGSLRDVSFHKAVFHDEHGDPAGQAGAIFDITERRHLERRLRALAETDPLTQLLNRRSFIERAARALDQARQAGRTMAMLVFDIDHFKLINDSHGHAAGDAVLCHLAHLIAGVLRSDDLFARLGGDEFALLVDGAEQAHAVAQRLPEQVAAQPLVLESVILPCRISLGAALLPPGQHTVDSALSHADVALYEAKRQGRNQAVCV